MKASLVTIHTGHNYGTVLQVIASVYVLNKHNIDVTVVNYIPPRCTYRYLLANTKKAIKSKKGVSKIKSILSGIHSLYFLWNTNLVFLGTIKRYCSLSNKIYWGDSFAKKCPKADYYITGSDQVWNSCHNQGIDTHYFFDGIEGRKYALSSSIGAESLSEEEKKRFHDFLKQYEAISVREDKAVELLREIGISSIQVLDPTLALNREEWHNAVSFRRMIKRDYLLLYIPYNVHDKEVILSFAKKIAVEKNLRIVTFTGMVKKRDEIDCLVLNTGPSGFISLMYYADCIITNSFHGTAFSINFNRNFWVFMPTAFTSRIESLLSLCGLEDRIVEEKRDVLYTQREIDYYRVNQVLDEERVKFNGFITCHFN
ncbi:MAG: polysaccharide pyruvyl transferase family protein [Paludibacteraceae bacterium]|nr:polysaccharide pyruvyl transferase family protein [Paludibacteraceae bacterium]